jgi:hypothetical protein
MEEKSGLRQQKKPNWRTGGVLDPGEIPPLPDSAAFAAKHGFPDPGVMEQRLRDARISLRIFAGTLNYNKAQVVDQFKSFDNSLCTLLDGLESEPFFSQLAFGDTGLETNEIILLLQNCYRSLKTAEVDLKADLLPLPNSSSGKRASPMSEKIYLRELKQIHLELVGKDRRVTYDPEAIEPDQKFKGLLFEFAKDCFKLEGIRISDGALSSRIKTMHQAMDSSNT